LFVGVKPRLPLREVRDSMPVAVEGRLLLFLDRAKEANDKSERIEVCEEAVEGRLLFRLEGSEGAGDVYAEGDADIVGELEELASLRRL
jgi:hypothetical protein